MRKKLILIVFTFICLSFFSTRANSAALEQGAYLEKNQWGALEYILNDCKSGKITTDECALYGCYVLAAQEPARADKAEKAKLLPSKYKLDKKSAEAGPYFFVHFLYDNEENLGKKATEEFRNSDWSDYEYFEKFKTDPGILKIIEKTPMESGEIFGSRYRNLNDIGNEIIKNKIMLPEEFYVIYNLFHNHFDFVKMIDRHRNFYKKYNIWYSHSAIDNHAFLYPLYNNFVKNTRNKKVINIKNYMNYAKKNLIKINLKYEESEHFIVYGDSNDQPIDYLAYFEKHYENSSGISILVYTRRIE